MLGQRCARVGCSSCSKQPCANVITALGIAPLGEASLFHANCIITPVGSKMSCVNAPIGTKGASCPSSNAGSIAARSGGCCASQPQPFSQRTDKKYRTGRRISLGASNYVFSRIIIGHSHDAQIETDQRRGQSTDKRVTRYCGCEGRYATDLKSGASPERYFAMWHDNLFWPFGGCASMSVARIESAAQTSGTGPASVRPPEFRALRPDQRCGSL